MMLGGWGVNRGPGESNGSLPPGLKLRVTCGLSAQDRDRLGNRTLVFAWDYIYIYIPLGGHITVSCCLYVCPSVCPSRSGP